MNTARLILDSPAAGTWNMAVDEALLQSAAQTGRLTLRVYAWAEPTLSLGYFQPYATRETHAASRSSAAVRRTTGGGAILHHHDITYSLTGPLQGRTDRQLPHWYDLVHDAWRDALAEQGLQAERCPRTDHGREQRFLCFERRAAGDLLLDGMKVGGSAQRRLPRAALQHGSILLKRSAAAPELPGIAELAGRELACRAWQEAWISQIARSLNVAWSVDRLTEAEAATVVCVQESKFASSAWSHRR